MSKNADKLFHKLQELEVELQRAKLVESDSEKKLSELYQVLEKARQDNSVARNKHTECSAKWREVRDAFIAAVLKIS